MHNSTRKQVTISFRLGSLIGWAMIAVLTLIPVFLWWRIQTGNLWGTPGQTMENIGLISGIVGTVLYSLSLVLMTRMRLLEWLFDGLNHVYITHHIVGSFSLIFTLLHPLGLALMRSESSVRDAALFLLPGGLTPWSALFDTSHVLHGVVLDKWAIFMGILALWLMVGLLLVTIFIKLPYRIWLISHKFLGLVFLMIALHIFFIQSDTSDDTLLKWYLLGAVVVGCIAFIYRTLMGQILIRKYHFVVDRVSDLGSGVVRFYLTPNGRAFNYMSGQFVFIRFLHTAGVGREWHPFSISSSSQVDSDLQLSIKSLGDYTSRLLQVQPGTIAEVEGAYGKFNYANYDNRDQVWIAGGIGITPFISMIKDLPSVGYRVYLFYSVKTRSEIIDWELLASEVALRRDVLCVVPFIGDEQGSLLDLDYIERVSGTIVGRDVYLCGPPSMMRALKVQLQDRGVPRTSIHSEEFSM